MTKPQILVVEDNEKNAKLVRDVLEFTGYEVAEARSAEAGKINRKRTPWNRIAARSQWPSSTCEALRPSPSSRSRRK